MERLSEHTSNSAAREGRVGVSLCAVDRGMEHLMRFRTLPGDHCRSYVAGCLDDAGDGNHFRYGDSVGGNTVVTAYSPATGLTYTIDCTGGSPRVCTGGTTHNASVYFTSGPSYSAPSAPSSTATLPSPPGNLTAYDHNVSVGPYTSWRFAENVFEAYAKDYQTNGEQSSDTVNVYSPVTNKSYKMACVTDGVTMDCTGGNKSYVTFPIQAAENY